MSSTVTTTCYPAVMPPMLPSIGEDEIFGGAAAVAAAESASVMILPATPAQVIPVSSSGGGSGAIKTYISVYNGEEEYVAVPYMVCIFLVHFSTWVA